ncbi:MAG: hypothetical protein HYV35_01590 [Lentisphaerae bacterium]|nr:hypothetical protein [Lentisphaerota bacterium]
MIANIGGRRELFLDEWLLADLRGASLQLQRPERRETAFVWDAPWEGNVGGANRVLAVDRGWRLYYRASILDLKREDDTTVVALAESHDGLTFTRPDLGLVEFQQSRRNNILQIGGGPNVPPPFYDTNPACPPDQCFKGIAGYRYKAYALCSADGLSWRPMQEDALDLPGQFDTINTAFWDRVTQCYRCYTRVYYDRDTRRLRQGAQRIGPNPTRAIQHATSPDFIHWSPPELLRYADGDCATQFYTNAILPCPGAEHFYLGFPNRFVAERKAEPAHPYGGVNDAVFMASRDGIHWRRWLDAWVTPGLDRRNWTDRNNYPAWGIAETSPAEWSLYITEHYRQTDTPLRLRRLSVRPWGFVSVRAAHTGGEVVTHPFIFSGATLRLNAKTSAAGSIRVELQDADGHPVPGLGLNDMAPWYGDELTAPVSWKNGSDLSAYAGRPVRLRFCLQDADLFAMQFAGHNLPVNRSSGIS